MNSITRKCNKCHQIKDHVFFSSIHKSLCLSCYGQVISEFTDVKNIPAIKENVPSERKLSSADKFVYLISGGDLTKIGITKNPTFRLNKLRLASPIPLTLIYSFRSKNARQTEIELHCIFRDKRLHGEWFTLSDDDIQSIKSKYH